MRLKCLMAIVVLLVSVGLRAEEAPKLVLKEGQRVAVVGDSITEQKQYSKFIELYLTACLPQLNLRVMQFGWGGETAGGFKGRMENDLMPYRPNLVTFCYGMNDGGYQKFNDGIGNSYKNNLSEIVKRLKAAGVTVVVGGPGVVDSKYFRTSPTVNPTIYNDNLQHLDALAAQIAAENGFNHADVFGSMMRAQNAAKEKMGEAYDVGGQDGVHPRANGHLVMAYAFLKAMGIDGNIGTITVDMKGGAEASEGHKIVSAANGKVEIESARSPFCFSGDGKSPDSTRSILPFVPFNQDLNRLTLIVKNLGSDKAKVEWGGYSQTFTKEELEKGINLADKFTGANPFTAYFSKLEGKIAQKQQYETQMIKSCINPLMFVPKVLDNDKEALDALTLIKTKLLSKNEKMSDEVRAMVAPVKHVIAVTEEK